jgi:rhodanese-related sulfurtransferase
MGLMDYIKPVPTKSADGVRDLMKDMGHDDYNLIDVRQPGEYENGHIPGAVLIPAGELSAHINELDPDKPTITY